MQSFIQNLFPDRLQLKGISMDSIFPSKETIWGVAPIDWCEENYTESTTIAELNNTITNIAYIIAAILLLWNMNTSVGPVGYKKSDDDIVHAPLTLSSYQGKIFVFYCIALFLTGVTSGIFHATLIW
jgi:hypothetical protein